MRQRTPRIIRKAGKNMPQNAYIYDPGNPVPDNVQHVTVPEGITVIPKDAFRRCARLQSVTLPDSVTEIGEFAFAGCAGLQSVTIPNGVTEIGEFAFYGCSSLQSVSIPNSVTKIRKGVFYRCRNLQSITIPDSVTYIGDSAFRGCSNLQSVTLPDSVTEIGEFAFAGCTGLQSITIPDSVTYIGDGAFSDCSRLQSVTIPDSVTEIGNNTFAYCLDLRSVTIPDSVTKIGESAFAGCAALQSITIPDSVTYIGDGAFSDCSGLQSVTIPDGISDIGNHTFACCSALQSVTIPDSVIYIGSGAFSNCSDLKSVTIPDGVMKISNRAFCGCSALQSVTIPGSVTEIGHYAFRDCFDLRSVTIPDGITEITPGAFMSCMHLQSAAIPDSVKKIGHNAFMNCSSLQSVTIPDSVTKIGNSAFMNCAALQSVEIPGGITGIGGGTFAYCHGLQDVTVPNGVTEISDSAFQGCAGLRSVTIPDSVTEIGNGAFRECDRLQSFMYKGANIAPLVNIRGYGVNTFDILKELIDYRIPLNKNTVKIGIDMDHQHKLLQWIRNYPVFGEMHIPASLKSVDREIKERLSQCFAGQKRTKHRIPQILDELAITACACGIPPERLAETFDIEYTGKLLGEKTPIVPAEACRCYYDRNTCDMLIRKGSISVMAEAIGLYNRSGHQECYKHLMDFILSHPDTRTDDLWYAVGHAAEIPMTAETILAQVRQHRAFSEALAEVTKIEAEYGKIISGFRLSDYPCNIDPAGITYNGMTARVLDLSDEKDIALAARLGELTNCCQCLGSAGETAMMHGFMNPDAGFWVIEDADGTVKAQAEIWVADGGCLVFDNIEFADTDSEHISDRTEQFRGVIAAWATESGYKNIIMGCGYNDLAVESMEQAPIPRLCLTPEEIFTMQEDNTAGMFFGNIDEAHRYMQTEEYDPADFVYTDADEQCVYIKKDGIVSDYLTQGYDRGSEEERPSRRHEAIKAHDGEIACE